MTPWLRALRATGVAVVLVAISGCGGDADPAGPPTNGSNSASTGADPREREILVALEQFRQATATGDNPRVCSLLSDQALAGLEEERGADDQSLEACADALEADAQERAANAAGELEVIDLQLEGRKAEVETKTGDERRLFVFVEEQGAWKFESGGPVGS